ncbi:MAG: GNAT family N-acetyltransferase [Streptococcaceae bacterium]|jgi:uncharacterized protein YuzE|nr:GNAT family N-acetyltransferase [Streptococcaceae bacterium]
MRELEFRKFEGNDIPIFQPIAQAAFNTDSQLHLKLDTGPPGYDSDSYLKRWFLSPKVHATAIYLNEEPIGAYSLKTNENNETILGSLFIAPTHHGKVLGVEIWQHIEESYPNTAVWKVDTPSFSTRNHHFYMDKLGFKLDEISGEEPAAIYYFSKKRREI